jgi:23S rRNA pseudouridine2605 synthase
MLTIVRGRRLYPSGSYFALTNANAVARRGVAACVGESTVTPIAEVYSSHDIPDVTTVVHKPGDETVQSPRSSSSLSSVRLSKLVATGCSISRREAERWIRQGLVTLAGRIITTPHSTVEWSDVRQGGALQANGKAVRVVENISDTTSKATTTASANKTTTRVWLVHKLLGEMVSDTDPLNRPCMMPRILPGLLGKHNSSNKQHLKAIGRLDMGTEGLILVTNDGQYAREMELPSSLLHRTYRVRVHGRLDDYKLERIMRGVTIDGVRYGPMQAQRDDTDHNRKRGRRRQAATSTNAWVQVTCTQGKNRQIRNVFQHFGLTVNRLIRIAYGDYQLQTIPPGMAIPVPTKPVLEQKRKGPLVFPPRRRNSVAAAQERNPHAATVQWRKADSF